MMLSLHNISAGYAAGPVIWDIGLEVNAGEIVTLIGANGAGKSTLVKTVSGLLRPLAGQIIYDGQPIGGLSAAERVRRGIAHVPEGRQVFAGLTVLENLRLGAYVHRRDEAGVRAGIDSVSALFPVLAARMDEVVGNFSGGQQQMLAIARGLMSRPRLLILDEPSLGLSPLLVAEIFTLIQTLRDHGIAILLSEQNARSALAISDRGTVIENGRVALSGTGRELLASNEVADRYLGINSATTVSTAKSHDLASRLRAIISP